MSLDAAQVRHVARLARLALTDDEVERFAAELSGIIDHVAAIGRLDLAGVEPMTHAVHLENVLRDDVPRPSLERELALREAPDPAADGFRVPRIGG
jgi:aspartyl-tRNA(Asn)/glutamyl-tRNA(Gln) amidotransferase subunit C